MVVRVEERVPLFPSNVAEEEEEEEEDELGAIPVVAFSRSPHWPIIILRAMS